MTSTFRGTTGDRKAPYCLLEPLASSWKGIMVLLLLHRCEGLFGSIWCNPTTGSIPFAPSLPQRRLSWQSRRHRHRSLASARKQIPTLLINTAAAHQAYSFAHIHPHDITNYYIP